MAVQLSEAIRNARLNAIETVVGTAPKLRIYSGLTPTFITSAPSGTLLSELSLPSDWLTTAASGSIAKAGTWVTGVGGVAVSGVAGYFRITDTAGSTTFIQGSISPVGSVGDLQLNNTTLTAGQALTINSFTLTDANA
jgi:hypothetical protein